MLSVKPPHCGPKGPHGYNGTHISFNVSLFSTDIKISFKSIVYEFVDSYFMIFERMQESVFSLSIFISMDFDRKFPASNSLQPPFK